MTPDQRVEAERLADWLAACGVVNLEVRETIALLRELAAEPQRQPLTEAEAERLYQNIKPSQQQDARSCAAFKRLLCVVESAHGIGEKK